MHWVLHYYTMERQYPNSKQLQSVCTYTPKKLETATVCTYSMYVSSNSMTEEKKKNRLQNGLSPSTNPNPQSDRLPRRGPAERKKSNHPPRRVQNHHQQQHPAATTSWREETPSGNTPSISGKCKTRPLLRPCCHHLLLFRISMSFCPVVHINKINQ